MILTFCSMLIMLFTNVYKINKVVKLGIFLKLIKLCMYKICIKSYIPLNRPRLNTTFYKLNYNMSSLKEILLKKQSSKSLWFMRQAGRYLPEFKKSDQKIQTLLSLSEAN